MQNSVISIRITSLYGSHPSSVVFTFKTAHYGPELLVSMGPRPYLSFCPCKTATLGPDLQVCRGPRPHLRFWALITECFAQEQKGYIGSRTHLWFCACKTATLGLQLQVSVSPRPTCWFCMQNSDFCIRITSVHWYQTSPFVLCIQISVINTRISSLYGFQPSAVVLCIQNSDFRTTITSFCQSKTHLLILHAKQRLLHQNNKCPLVPDLTFRFVHSNQRD